MLVFGEKDSRCLCNFLKTHIFWKSDHIYRTYNAFFDVFSEKDPHLNAVESSIVMSVPKWNFTFLLQFSESKIVLSSLDSDTTMIVYLCCSGYNSSILGVKLLRFRLLKLDVILYC